MKGEYDSKFYTIIHGNMSQLYIVHLSDLHICKKKLNKTLGAIIKDIKAQTEKIDKLLVVVSGDVVDKGNYDDGLEGVLEFFKELRTVLGNRIVDIVFVPGNHDKVQHNDIKMFGKIEDKSRIDINEEIWSLQKEHYNCYIQMVNEVRKLFDFTDEQEKTFFVKRIEINNMLVFLVGIDTTWVSYGEEKEGELLIGAYQLGQLYNEYKCLKEDDEMSDGKSMLTIGIGHHPTSWINSNDRKKLKKYMIDDEYFGMNLYLCGHIHDMEMENWHNNTSSIMTLVTGIGWDHIQETSSLKDKKDEHRYSIYAIDVEKNVVNICVRKTNNSGNFINDNDLYSDDSKKQLTFPLAIRTDKQPILNLNCSQQRLINSLYMDNDFILLVSKIHSCMIGFEKQVTSLSYYNISNLASILLGEGFEKDDDIIKYLYGEITEVNDEISSVLTKNQNILFDIFLAYIQEIATYFVATCKDILDVDQVIRFHFRVYKKDEDSYHSLCQCSSDNKYKDSVKTIKWGGLIKDAYEKGQSLIFSINSDINIIKTDWEDFMTMVPDFLNNETEKIKDRKHEKRPIITCGISVRGFSNKADGSNILYALEYLGLCEMIGSCIDEFVMKYQIDVGKFARNIFNQR